ncbi:MAG: 7TM diverse intracellular signaling domain-containing protein [Myxococcota bacterium]|nr:7TM diverse intracellular signaling domain-containing protein [Myxococcota bacterium]
MLKLGLFITLGFAVLSPTADAAPVPVNSSRISLSDSVYFYSVESNAEKSERLLPSKELFQLTKKSIPNLGLDPRIHWFKVTLVNRLESQRFVVEAGYPLLDYVDFYIERESQIEGPVESGDLRPFLSRYRPHRTLNFAVDMESGETVTLYFRVNTESSVQLPLTLYTSTAFGDSAAAENIGFGFLYGSLIVIMFFNLLQWVMIRQAIYFKYFAYLLTCCVFQMAINGSLFEWVLPSHPDIANGTLLVSNFMGWAFLFEFGSEFVNLRAISLRFQRIVKLITVACYGAALASFVLPYRSLVSFVVIFALVFPVILGAMGIFASRAGQRSAKYFTLAFALFLTGSILYALKTATILPSHFVTEYAIQIGSVFQVILLSLALGDQAREVFEQRDRLMSEVLDKTKALSAEAETRSKLQRERAEAVEELRLEAETKVALFSDATHHLNNPLNHITGAREIISGELLLVRERIDVILPEDEDPDVKAVRKAFRANFTKISESEMRLDDALSRASNAVAVLRAVSGVDGVGIEPCFFGEIWTLLRERIFIAEDNTRLSPPAEFMQEQVLGAPGLYAQAMEVVLEAAQHVPKVSYSVTEDECVIHFEGANLTREVLEGLILKINHLIKVTGAKASLAADDIVTFRLPRLVTPNLSSTTIGLKT